MVNDHGEVPLPLADRDLIDPDPFQTGEQVACGPLLGHHPLADPAHGPPCDPHQLCDGGLVRADRQPRHLILEGASEAGIVPRPRHRRDHHPVLAAADARRPRLQVGERRAEIQRPPAPAPALTPVIAGATSPTVGAAIPLPRHRADRHHHRPVALHRDVLDNRPVQTEQLLPYPSSAHAATALS
jgi:hypothetical protein